MPGSNPWPRNVYSSHRSEVEEVGRSHKGASMLNILMKWVRVGLKAKGK
jgi:hypothetical protein